MGMDSMNFGGTEKSKDDLNDVFGAGIKKTLEETVAENTAGFTPDTGLADTMERIQKERESGTN